MSNKEVGTQMCVGGILGDSLPVQCASCPFRDGNNAEFAVIVNRLRKKAGMRQVLPTSKLVQQARSKVRVETAMIGTGRFACHHTAYDEDMNVRPLNEHRQCPGAVEFLTKWQILRKR